MKINNNIANERAILRMEQNRLAIEKILYFAQRVNCMAN